MKITFLVLLCIITFNYTFGQNREKYGELVQEARDLFANKEYLKSGQKYADAFIELGGKGSIYDRYNAATSWALAKQTDSAFVQLFKLAEKAGYSNYEKLTTDKNFKSIKKDGRWNELLVLVAENKRIEDEKLDKELVAVLEAIYEEDQKYRHQLDKIEKKHGWDSKKANAQWELIEEKDSINLIKVKEILDTRGWLGYDIVGDKGNSALFLVIQHSDIETQEHYLPMMKEAAKRGDASPSDLALLIDRVALGKGEKQVYGSQIGQNPNTGKLFVLPLEDPDNVNSRRAEVGLGTIEEYVKYFGLTWDVEEYKASLVEEKSE